MDDKDYLCVLKGIQEIPFNVGKNLLIDFLQGETENESIKKNKLFYLKNFGSLSYTNDELSELIESLARNKLIKYTALSKNKYWKVIQITPEGYDELINPKFFKKKVSYSFTPRKTKITKKDKDLFKSFDFFLEKYNDDQKKAITTSSKNTLCIAGAGSGKTTVLTKRIEFLVRYRSVPENKILAITFTRKARTEMQMRLEKNNIKNVNVETFNSFCEKILREHEGEIYARQMRVMSYRDKIAAVRFGLSKLGLDINRAISIYFTKTQERYKTKEQLFITFINDCFTILDYLKSKNKELWDFSNEADNIYKQSAKLIYNLCKGIDSYMQENGLRDYTDQILDALNFLKQNPTKVPFFEHILIDEYQDVNSLQIELIDILKKNNMFCVGDPRQSIFGWRGSDIKYILDFEEKKSDTETITLTKNYRSTKYIVDLINKSIKKLRMPDLKSEIAGEKDVKLLNFDSDVVEYEFVIQRILNTDMNRKEIFVLARTNKQLKELSDQLKIRKIPHIIKSEDMNRTKEAEEGEITLATIHAIKGLEAKMVFVIGATMQNFPCKASEHPVTEIVKVDEYDKEEEERRLFYVALSRAKESLYISYTGSSHTYFITEDMIATIEKQDNNKKTETIYDKLREWRKKESETLFIPAFKIMHDSTLNELADKRPVSNEELKTISGIGPAKISRYGKELLRIVNE